VSAELPVGLLLVLSAFVALPCKATAKINFTCSWGFVSG
jgi:hypothetical protein